MLYILAVPTDPFTSSQDDGECGRGTVLLFELVIRLGIPTDPFLLVSLQQFGHLVAVGACLQQIRKYLGRLWSHSFFIL